MSILNFMINVKRYFGTGLALSLFAGRVLSSESESAKACIIPGLIEGLRAHI